MMYQAKISLTEPLVEFLASYKTYGFKDKSAMVRAALAQLQQNLELEQLKASAELYAELYEDEAELQEITAAALAEWPE
jgi:Arc/MetJ-type ribon-helix-helix transcriptional regulator